MDKKWDQVFRIGILKPKVKWFEGGKLNITENCLDRHLKNKGKQTAIKWIANNPNEKHIVNLQELHLKVCKFANVLKNNAQKKEIEFALYAYGPRVAIAVLACARIGAIHSVVFAGFSAKSLSDRINDATCNIVNYSDGGFEGENYTTKKIADEA